jgi:hypothetical protein
MKIIPFILVAILILPESIIPICKTYAYPIIDKYDAEMTIATAATHHGEEHFLENTTTAVAREGEEHPLHFLENTTTAVAREGEEHPLHFLENTTTAVARDGEEHPLNFLENVTATTPFT